MTLYLTLKALHIVAMVAWLAGLLYLPRLFVYHVQADVQGDIKTGETFKTMERRLLKLIMNPAMIAVWVLGLALLWQMPDYLHQGWFHAKALCVVLLTGLHHAYGRYLKAFAAGNNRHSAKFYRIMNEIPAVLLVVIVFLVVFKAF